MKVLQIPDLQQLSLFLGEGYYLYAMNEMKLNTPVSLIPSDWKISHNSKIATIGSCFADVMGEQLSNYKFSVLNNPLGTVFNPITICRLLDSVLEERVPNPDLFLQNSDEIWMHHDFHSSQWSTDKQELEAALMLRMNEIRTFLKQTDVLVITLGTAYAYRHRQTNQIIGNCHKLPSDKFVKELLSPDQINPALEQLIQKLLSFKRDLRVIVTISPVRHTKDTLPLNQVSKSILRLVTHRITEKYKHVTYFPSYEIMIDELRDYRFYEKDMIHPNEIAEAYIFQAFANHYISPGSLKFMEVWEGIARTMNHRPLHGLTKSHFQFLTSLQSKLTEISDQIDVSDELSEIERRIGEFPVL